MQWKRNETAFPTKKTSSSNNSCNSCSNCCFFLKKRACEGAVREPRESIIDVRDPLGRALFSYLFSASIFSHKIEIFNENCTFGNCFQKMRENRKVRFDCTGAYGLHLSPHRGVPRATQNYIKKQKDSRNLFFYGKTTN